MSILQKKKIDIPEPKNYNFTELKSDLSACGLEHLSFYKRNEGLFKDLVIEKDQNIIAVLCNKMEHTFSKRELAFLLSKVAMANMIREQKTKKSENE